MKFSKNRIKGFCLLFFLFLFLSGFSQEVIIQVTPPPPGQITIEDLYQSIFIINNSPEQLEVYLSADATEESDGPVSEASSSVFFAPPGAYFVDVEELAPIDVSYALPEYEEIAITTGSVPAGYYTICFRVHDAVTGQILAEDCFFHEVSHPSPPILLFPLDGEALIAFNPVFSWLPPSPILFEQIVFYRLKIVEILEGQSLIDAIQNNLPWLEEFDIDIPSFLYPLDARALEPGVSYGWQVQAYLENGMPYGENEGNSEPFVFSAVDMPGILTINPISPVNMCVGEVAEEGLTSNVLTFQWEAIGEFDHFEVIVYENPCGRYPPTPTPTPTPTPPVPTPVPTPSPSPTPTPTPTPSPTPVDSIVPAPDIPVSPQPPIDIGVDPDPDTTTTTPPVPPPPGGDIDFPGEGPDEGLPPLPPGWEWGPDGAPTWTGEHPPEPPALPPGWEWGPLRPVWTGEGEPPNRSIVATSDYIFPPAGTGPNEAVFHSFDFDLENVLRPGQAFIYQIYGIAENAEGEMTGMLSETQCLRFSPVTLSGDIPEAEDCEKAGCSLAYTWIRKTPIKVIKPLSNFPKGEALQEMIPGTCISFSVLGNDVDLIKQTCTGQEDCLEEEEAVKRIGPIEHGVQYKWTLNGEGKLAYICENTIFYQLPKNFKKNETKKIDIDCELSNVGGKAQDDPIKGKIKIEAQMIDSCKCLNVKVDIQQPKEKTYNDDFKEKESKLCKPKDPEWKKAADINGTLTVQKIICPEAMTIFKAAYHDNDKLKLKCEAESCGKDEEEMELNDPLKFTWNDGGAGGSFPLGNTGPCVLYKGPSDEKNINIKVNVKDSGTQYNDKSKDGNEKTETKKLLDLAEINVNEEDKYSNITVGHSHKFKPVWKPENAKVTKIVWELDLGGKSGKIKKVLCDPKGLTPDKASLKFTTKSTETNLEVSWKKRTHIHGMKTLKCEIFGEVEPNCMESCICRDSVWKESDFLGRDEAKWNQFMLFFEKKAMRDDGKVENLATVANEDHYGETTKLHKVICSNWFLHWSKSTYGTCQHDHKNTDPKVLYRKSASWLGLYKPKPQKIYLSEKSAGASERDQWTGDRWVVSSNMKWIDTRTKTQRAYDLKGHTLCNKVYIHEYGHFTSMTKNWRPGEVWAKKYGARSDKDVEKGSWPFPTSKHLEVEVDTCGNYSGKIEDGKDCLQKYNVNIKVYKGYGDNKVLVKTVALQHAWFGKGVKIKWPGKKFVGTGTVTSSKFTAKTKKKTWKLKGLKLTENDRANDPDKDFVPNEVEDQLGLYWNDSRTHKNHARSKPETNDGKKTLPDQEFYADQYAFDRWNLIDPGKPKKDWANPGAQSTPKFEK